MDSIKELEQDRPIYTKLPSVFSEFCSFEHLTDSAYLVEFWENVYKFWNHNLDNIFDFTGNYQNFTYNQLKALAPFFGFSGKWYNQNWTKDQLIKLYWGVYRPPRIWVNRGSVTVFNYIMDVLNIPGNLSQRSAFIAGRSKAGDVCGSSDRNKYILYLPENLTPSEYESLHWILSGFIPLHIHVEQIATQDLALTQRPYNPYIPSI
jgi:hypothetical protein